MSYQLSQRVLQRFFSTAKPSTTTTFCSWPTSGYIVTTLSRIIIQFCCNYWLKLYQIVLHNVIFSKRELCAMYFSEAASLIWERHVQRTLFISQQINECHIGNCFCCKLWCAFLIFSVPLRKWMMIGFSARNLSLFGGKIASPLGFFKTSTSSFSSLGPAFFLILAFPSFSWTETLTFAI